MMRAALLSVLAVLIFSISAFAQPKTGPVYNLVVNNRSICTCFSVLGPRKERMVYSAGHCADELRPTDKIYAWRKETGEKYPLRLARYSYKWPEQDSAVFYYTGKYPEAGLELTSRVPEPGEQNWAMIAPIGLNPFLVTGIYSGRAGDADQVDEIDGMFLVAIQGTHGASGSPVFDKDGRVWGILVGGWRELPSVMLIVRVPQI